MSRFNGQLIRAPQAVFPLLVQDVDFRMFGDEIVGDFSGAVGGIAIHDEHIDRDGQVQYPLGERWKIRPLVIGWDHYKRLVHALKGGKSIPDDARENKPHWM
jgi:hypothetical protein